MTWTQSRLGDLLTVEHGFAFKGEYFSDAGELVVLTPGNFHERGGFRPRPEKDRFYLAAFPERYLLKQGDLIVAMTEQGEGLLGSSALIPEGGRYLHNQRLGLIREKPSKADRRFLYYLFNAPTVREQIRNSSSGAKVRHTSPERICSVLVRAPDPGSQRKIAAILSAYDDLIANNQRRIALLEGMAEEIYREWFVRMRFPGHARARFKSGLPDGWTQCRLSAVAEVNARSMKNGSGPELIRYVDISAVGTNEMNWPDEIPFSQAPGRARRIVRSGDILWSSVRPGNKAYCIVVSAAANLVASTGFAVISPKPGQPYSYLHQATTTQNFVDQMVAIAKGSAYPATSFDDFRRALIIWPDASLLSEFDALCKPMYEQVDGLRAANRQLATLRDALLPRLISGKLKVDHLAIRLPPSMQESVTT
ncbi:MAG: restriction endonuclease subunit S [Candidatus Accumulibacter sp.]|uniref:restriction endonuclease subunit S n=1 Tax=Accumulibacter sp. TaxID=2053492 RepID=UPI001A41B61B|nr:restriction endonuclease subunit S [Accumulibacter sp.]MBL8394871.1 restriction endonuclease subunit S [Accumulibacter sp.]